MNGQLSSISLKFVDPKVEKAWRVEANARVNRGLNWGTVLIVILLGLSIIRDLILRWDGWESLMLFRLFVIIPIVMAPWVLSKTRYGAHHREGIIVTILSILFIALGLMFIWLPALPWGSKPLISVLFLPILAATVTISPIGFKSTLILCLMGLVSFAVAYLQIDTSFIEFSIMCWSVFGLGGIMCGASWRLERQERIAWLRKQEVEEEQQKSRALLENVFPPPVAQRLLNDETPIADRYDSIVVLFADVVGFTPMARQMSPSALVDRLDRVFSDFDQYLAQYQFTKVKTIGDAYMAAGGLPWEPNDNRTQSGVKLALELERCAREDHGLQLRLGMHQGPCVAGVIGHERFIYDFWGDTVNIASRLEASGEVGKVHVSQEIRDALPNGDACESAGLTTLKGVGDVPTYWINSAPDAV